MMKMMTALMVMISLQVTMKDHCRLQQWQMMMQMTMMMVTKKIYNHHRVTTNHVELTTLMMMHQSSGRVLLLMKKVTKRMQIEMDSMMMEKMKDKREMQTLMVDDTMRMRVVIKMMMNLMMIMILDN